MTKVIRRIRRCSQTGPGFRTTAARFRPSAVRPAVLVAALLLLPALLAGAQDSSQIRRFGVFIGANDGGAQRVRLRWAASDAEKLAEVLQEIGGLSPQDTTVLVDPDSDRVHTHMLELKDQVRAAKGVSRRVELMVYYSGHSDEYGLMLGDGHYGYARLRQDIKDIEADVSIAILDSCASGAFTRLKGGARVQPFLVDDATKMSGHAFLTSSSEDEASQESDAIGSSFFTHYIISGLRGGADATGDGRVTLNEIYQYAYNETLARTERTYAGPQHPSYDIQLNGTGDLVLTDITTPSASLRVAEGIQGRLFFRNSRGILLAEVQKSSGSPLSIALPPDEYRVTLNQTQVSYESVVRIRRGFPNRLSPADFAPTAREYAIPRGDTAFEYGAAEPAPLPSIPTFISLGFVPGIATAGNQYSPTFAVGLLIAAHQRVDGIMTSSVGNIATERLRGAQMAGVFNVAGPGSKGVQMAGVFNLADYDLDGVQVSGVFNQTRGVMKGIQVAPVFNAAGGTRGAQVSLVNIGGDVRGSQIGLVNIGKTVYGAQIGLVNISNDIFGAPIGLVNLVENGITDASYWLEAGDRAWVGLQNGSRHFYTLVYAGMERKTDLKQLAGLSAGAGIGARIIGGPFFFDMDVSMRKTSDGESSQERFAGLFNGSVGSVFPTVRLLAGISIGEGFGFFAGGTFDAHIPGVTVKAAGYHDGEDLYPLDGGQGSVELYPKFVLGFKL